MCKTEEKMDKINFYKFIWVYWRMKKKCINICFGCFQVEEIIIIIIINLGGGGGGGGERNGAGMG